MKETAQDFIAHIKAANNDLDEKLRDLRELSLQLQEYSRILKQQSDDINMRLRCCVNLRRAA